MVRRQRSEAGREISDLFARGSDAKRSAIFLQQVNTSAPKRRIDHHMQRAGWRKNLAERSKTCIRVRKVVKDTGANDMVEGGLELSSTLDRQLHDLQVVQAMLQLEFLSIFNAVGTDIDSRHPRLRPTQSISRRLRGTAPCDENAAIISIGLARPKQMRFRPPPMAIVPKSAIARKVVDRRRIGMALVELFYPVLYSAYGSGFFAQFSIAKMARNGSIWLRRVRRMPDAGFLQRRFVSGCRHRRHLEGLQAQHRD